MEVTSNPERYLLPYPFLAVQESLAKLPAVDGVTVGRSPATVRWLTPKNLFINVGLVEVDDKSCEVIRNNNSYAVAEDDLKDAYTRIRSHLDDEAGKRV